ncbi:hypothetical protein EB821_05425 [Candidatus Marinimicrobia bacterium PRS2]|nr:hypothetical protein EB821_05425 [Candidatus Marinimicrobia bacterium PRS2]
MKKLIFILMVGSLFLSCSDKESTAPCNGVVDECGVCDGDGKQTTYVEVCEEEYVCNNVTTWVQLYGDSYCANGCGNMNGNYCQSYDDCYYYGGFESSGCNTGHQCITTTQETEYVCGNQMVCENIPTTSCP